MPVCKAYRVGAMGTNEDSRPRPLSSEQDLELLLSRNWHLLPLTFFSPKLFPTIVLEVSGDEGRNSPPSEIPPKRSTGPNEPPVDNRAKRNTRQRARRHRSQTSRFNQQRPSQAHLLCLREIPQSPGRLGIHHRQIPGQWRCKAGSPGPRIARPLATERTRPSLCACEPATYHC